jgi:hypothetical protein
MKLARLVAITAVLLVLANGLAPTAAHAASTGTLEIAGVALGAYIVLVVVATVSTYGRIVDASEPTLADRNAPPDRVRFGSHCPQGAERTVLVCW